MSKCPQCGFDVLDSKFSFCPQCGTRLGCSETMSVGEQNAVDDEKSKGEEELGKARREGYERCVREDLAVGLILCLVGAVIGAYFGWRVAGSSGVWIGAIIGIGVLGGCVARSGMGCVCGFVLMLGFCSLFPIVGCVVVKGTSEVWREDFEDMSVEGPGSDDAVFSRVTRNYYRVDDGSRVAFGFFPGAAFLSETGEVAQIESSAGEFFECNSTDVAGPLTLLTLGSVVGTIVSMTYSPFAETEWSLVSLFGFHRWHVTNATDQLLRSGEMEVVAVKGKTSQTVATQAGRMSNGDLLFFEYPGFDVIYGASTTSETVNVVFNGAFGDSNPSFATSMMLRRFSRSRRCEGGLTFRDVEAENDPMAFSQILHRLKFGRLRTQVDSICDAKGYKVADKTLVADIASLKSEIDAEFNRTVMLDNDVFLVMSNRYVNLVQRLDAANRLSSQKEDERVEGKKAELEKKFSEGRFEDVISGCDAEQFGEPRHAEIWQRLVVKARNEIAKREKEKRERERIAAALKREKEEAAAALERARIREAAKKSFEEDVEKAKQNDAEAMFRVGETYRLGNEAVSKDLKLARKYLRRAYENGCAKAWGSLEKLCE